jgi:hypothetical protein
LSNQRKQQLTIERNSFWRSARATGLRNLFLLLKF